MRKLDFFVTKTVREKVSEPPDEISDTRVSQGLVDSYNEDFGEALAARNDSSEDIIENNVSISEINNNNNEGNSEFLSDQHDIGLWPSIISDGMRDYWINCGCSLLIV